MNLFWRGLPADASEIADPLRLHRIKKDWPEQGLFVLETVSF